MRSGGGDRTIIFMAGPAARGTMGSQDSKARLKEFLDIVFDKLSLHNSGGVFCRFRNSVEDYQTLSMGLKAAGHDTTELADAITRVTLAGDNLKNVARRALADFKQKGVLDPDRPP